MNQTIATEKEKNIQLAENEFVDTEAADNTDEKSEFEKKRELLEKTKIVRQTWSILEIYQKIKDHNLVLTPDYQRSVVWKNDKKTAFIESLYMEIMIPPIYVVEIPGEDLLAANKYEVVDGKQRLTAIMEFVSGKLELTKKSLEYYADIFGGKNFNDIKEAYTEKTTQMLSSILDIYVITSNSPEFTKYDIFARLNKGAEPLRVNEIRRAIYHSNVTSTISAYIEKHIGKDASPELAEEYKKHFSQNDIIRFEDYGRFYRSIAFYVRADKEQSIVRSYNSRPRDMINGVLQCLQEKSVNLAIADVEKIIERTMDLLTCFSRSENRDYLVDACIPYAIEDWEKLQEKTREIMSDDSIAKTLVKSPATTSNVNARLKRVKEIIEG